MWLYIIFPIIVVVLDYFAYKAKGSLVAFIIAIIGVPLLAMGLPLLVAPHVLTSAPVYISTPNGNIIISSYNQTLAPSNATQSLLLLFAELPIFVQFGYAMIILVQWFAAWRIRKYRR
ncbi:MAG: hypothetical protein QW575_08630 [Thermoproteota archaeon]